MVDKVLIPLDQKKWPGCYYHHSNPNDVARVEHLTFICTRNKEDAGPNNNWMSPEEGKEHVRPLFAGSMKGRTMYVVPYVMGPAESPFSRVGVEVADDSSTTVAAYSGRARVTGSSGNQVTLARVSNRASTYNPGVGGSGLGFRCVKLIER